MWVWVCFRNGDLTPQCLWIHQTNPRHNAIGGKMNIKIQKKEWHKFMLERLLKWSPTLVPEGRPTMPRVFCFDRCFESVLKNLSRDSHCIFHSSRDCPMLPTVTITHDSFCLCQCLLQTFEGYCWFPLSVFCLSTPCPPPNLLSAKQCKFSLIFLLEVSGIQTQLRCQFLAAYYKDN